MSKPFRIVYEGAVTDVPITPEICHRYARQADPGPPTYSDVAGMIHVQATARAMCALRTGRLAAYHANIAALNAIESALISSHEAVYACALPAADVHAMSVDRLPPGTCMTFRGVPVVRDDSVPWVDFVVREAA